MALAVVTGGAGFIGSHLIRGLLARGHRVRVIDQVPPEGGPSQNGLEIDWVVGDIRDRSVVGKAVEASDWIFHQAAFVSVSASVEDPVTCYDVNLGGSLNVLRAASEAGVNRVILASSAAVYGESQGPVGEAAHPAPMTPYAASKLAMEEAAMLFQRLYGLPTVCLRYFNVYGPRQQPDSPYAAVIPAFIRAMLAGQPREIHGDGNQRRDFVYVDDVVRANLVAAESDAAVGQVLNISGGSSVTVSELAEILQGILPDAPAPVHAPAREGDIYFSEAILDRAKGALGYRPEVGLEEGLRSTVEWFVQERLKTAP